MKKILIMGLSGSGKSTLAEVLNAILLQNGKSVKRLNGDIIRTTFNDWDFSEKGRIRQAKRMKELSNDNSVDFVLCDFIAPLKEMRDIFQPDILIWMDTIKKSRHDDTDSIFQSPIAPHFRVINKEANKYGKMISKIILANK